MPTVSIIVPCYNGARFVSETLQSVCDQTLTDWECIIVDDGSTDDSAAVVKPFLLDNRFRYLYQENRGLSEARNTGMRHATGEYLQFLDADDLLLPEKLASQIQFLEEHPSFALVATGFIRTSEAGKEIGRNTYPAGEIHSELLEEAKFVVHAALLRRNWAERVGEFEPTLRAAEDWDYWCRLLLLDGRQYRTADAQVTYRQVGNAMTTNVERQTEMLLRVVERSHRLLHDRNEATVGGFESDKIHFPETQKGAARARVLHNGAARAVALGKPELALEYLNRAQGLPSDFRAYDWEPWLRRVAFLIRHYGNAEYLEVLDGFFIHARTEFPTLAPYAHRAKLLARLVNERSPARTLLWDFFRAPIQTLQAVFHTLRYQFEKRKSV